METKDKLARLCFEKGIKRKAISEYTGANKSTISTWFNGVSKPSGIYLPALCDLLECDAGWLMDDSKPWEGPLKLRAPRFKVVNAPQVNESSPEYFTGIESWDSSTELPPDEVELKFFTEVQASAGNGNMHIQENHGPKLRFSKSTLSRYNIDPKNAACIKVKGNSMEPVLPDGSTIGVDLTNTSIIDGKMYAIDHDGMLRVKMLYRLPGGGIRLRSYNTDEHQDEQYNGEEAKNIRIIGRVFWSSVLY